MLSESDIQAVVQRILAREGGFIDNPSDHGGRTNFGLTQSFYDDWEARASSVPGYPADVKDLTRAQAAGVYRDSLAHWRLDQIPDANTLDLVADCAVNHGSGRAVKWLQRALGVNDDGVLGPQTLAAIAAVPQGIEGWPAIYRNILIERILFYGAIVHNDPSQAVFINGWLNRAVTFLSPPAA